jgi:hypothetical protein
VSHLAGESERAVKELSRAAQRDPANARVLYPWGGALWAVGLQRAAHDQFERVLSLDPSFPTAREIRTALARR